MSASSSIEWTDATWNPVRGCNKVSTGCKNCYAETFSERWRGVKGHAFEQGFDLRLVPEKLAEPLRWKAPRRIFVNSMSDLFHEGIDDDYIDRVFGVMAACQYIGHRGAVYPGHTFQVLTKRVERLARYLSTDRRAAWARWAVNYGGECDPDGIRDQVTMGPQALPNVWLGVSVENQEAADERIPHLMRVPGAVRFLSCEPLLGPISFRPKATSTADMMRLMDLGIADKPAVLGDRVMPLIDWVIVGGESGPGSRAFDLAWARSIVNQCRAAGVACFVKQLGALPISSSPDDKRHVGDTMLPSPFRLILANRKGGDPSDWPEDLRVREFPR